MNTKALKGMMAAGMMIMVVAMMVVIVVIGDNGGDGSGDNKRFYNQASAPGVYSRVTSQLSWINSKISGATCPR